MPFYFLKQRILTGESLLGCFLQLGSPTAAEVCGLAGVDFIVIDAEHSEIDLETTAHMIRAADSVGLPAIVRCAVNEPQVILRYMDLGAAGIQIPQINTVEEAQQVVNSVKYRPIGRRGLASVRAGNYFMNMSAREYIRMVNDHALVVIHIETPESLSALQEISRVDGIDVLFIGPTDLSYSLGFPGEPNEPAVQDAFNQVISAARQNGKASGMMASNPSAAAQYIDRGIQYITTSDKVELTSGIHRYLSQVHSFRKELDKG